MSRNRRRDTTSDKCRSSHAIKKIEASASSVGAAADTNHGRRLRIAGGGSAAARASNLGQPLAPNSVAESNRAEASFLSARFFPGNAVLQLGALRRLRYRLSLPHSHLTRLSGERAKRQQADNLRAFSAWLWARLAKPPRAEERQRYHRVFHLKGAKSRGCAVDRA